MLSRIPLNYLDFHLFSSFLQKVMQIISIKKIGLIWFSRIFIDKAEIKMSVLMDAKKFDSSYGF